jgi:hypothetical protein
LPTDNAALVAIAERAIEYHDAEVAVRAARDDFFDALCVCELEMGVSDYVQRGTDAGQMLKDKTTVEFEGLQKAKRARDNALRRLQSTIRRCRAKGAK